MYPTSDVTKSGVETFVLKCREISACVGAAMFGWRTCQWVPPSVVPNSVCASGCPCGLRVHPVPASRKKKSQQPGEIDGCHVDPASVVVYMTECSAKTSKLPVVAE